MADVKIQDLTNETNLTDNHLFITQEDSNTAETKKTTLGLLKSFLNMLDFFDISQYFVEGTNVNISIDNDTQKITISATGTGEKGDKGDNGFSPIATVEQTETGAVISITDSKGTTTANLTNGINGISPTAKIEQTETGATITIVDGEGTTTANLLNGSDGTNGTNGITPHIDEVTKHWFIGETDSNIVAEGKDGISPKIDETTKHWFIGDVDTGIIAEGVTTISTTSVTYTGILTVDGWVGDTAPYTQIINVNGMTADLSPIIDLIVSDDITTADEEISQWAYVTKAMTGDNTITFRCNKTKPTIELNFKVKVV